jgi:hypothetical protein
MRLLLLLALLPAVSLGQLSKPIAVDSQVDANNNKYLQREASEDDGIHIPG